MRLNQLLKHLTYEHVQGSQSREITDICYHSGNVREGSLFVCLKGLHNDGHDYLQGALEAGAAAVVVAAENVVPLDNDALLYTEQFGVRISEVIDRWQVSVVIAADTRHALAELAAAFLIIRRQSFVWLESRERKGRQRRRICFLRFFERAGIRPE